MLIISRKKDDKFIIGDEIEIVVMEIGRNRVRLGIKAPKHVKIHTHLKGIPGEEQPASSGAEISVARTGKE